MTTPSGPAAQQGSLSHQKKSSTVCSRFGRWARQTCEGTTGKEEYRFVFDILFLWKGGIKKKFGHEGKYHKML